MKSVIASLFSALVLLLWSVLYWIILPIPTSTTLAIPQEERLLAKLKEDLPESGVYFYPSLPERAFEPELTQKFKQGPLLQIFYQKDGYNPFSISQILLGFFYFWISSLLLLSVLYVIGAQLFSFRRRLLLIGTLGLFAAIATHGFYPVWFHQDFLYHGAQMLFNWIGFLLAGIVLARFLKPAHTFSGLLSFSIS